ncbi:30S ribosomal protein S4 [Candidatus Micrarchaeota archaeon]|nr:30S ribosomal protein S4 [Candidatus Micrarchaeota archaeon]MBU1166572.1 30S ribosomal protein S4 [Candidatus Micrarchaeota archaeon]MBU1887296.1 30S ribosomal protein S4 [Candidatus Micrarchaeota archaeon]
MGDPKRFRNKYEAPKKLWDVERIRHDRGFKLEYGLKNMSEIWRANGELKKYRREARRLLSLTVDERRMDAEKILKKLIKLGVLKESSVIDDVLSLEIRSILERRLQTVVMRKGLSRTIKQARQLITHGFISINGRKVTRPGCMIDMGQEASISYNKPIDISVKSAEPEPTAEPEPQKPTDESTLKKEEVVTGETPSVS